MNNSIDQQFIEFVVKSLVSKPDAVQVERRIDEKGVLLELTVDPEDLGRVIGKRGATAQSLRTLLRALGTKNDARYNLKIVDNGEPRPERHHDDHVAAPVTQDDNDVPLDDVALAKDTTSTPTPAVSDDDESVLEVQGDTSSEAEDHSDRVSQTRKELEELDDLDV